MVWENGRRHGASARGTASDFRKSLRNTATRFDEVERQAMNLSTESFPQLSRLCVANGIEYVHVLQPNQHLPGSRPMGTKERKEA